MPCLQRSGLPKNDNHLFTIRLWSLIFRFEFAFVFNSELLTLVYLYKRTQTNGLQFVKLADVVFLCKERS